MTSGFVLGPGEGSAYGFHGSVAVIKASGEDTFGQLGVIESVYPAALSVHEHVHAGEDEMFYLLGGSWTCSAGRTAGPSARGASSSCRATGRTASRSAVPGTQGANLEL
jgi:uncharacterized cupin superfamily protein